MLNILINLTEETKEHVKSLAREIDEVMIIPDECMFIVEVNLMA